MYINRHRIPIHLHIIYGAGNLALNGLNMLWFSKMFAKMIARLHGEDEPKSKSKSKSKDSRMTETEEKKPLLAKVGAEEEEEGGLTLPASPPSPVATVPKEAL